MSPEAHWATSWPDGEQRSPSPADRARLALCDDSGRSDREIAIAVRVTVRTVQRTRRSLEDVGAIAVTRTPRRRFPEYVPRPHQPAELQQGACVGHPRADAWTSSDAEDRAFAAHLCRDACPVQQACLTWALTAAPSHDGAIYAGTTATQRTRLRRERGVVTPRLVGQVLINSLKTVCGTCDLPLSGRNLYVERLADGRERRHCVACRSRAGREWAARQARASA